jgi:hypothetical protein
MSTQDNSNVTDNFPHKTIPTIVGQPTYDAIKELHLKLNENAVKVHSNLGNGLLGYLGVTVTPAIFNTLSNTPFAIPPNPGVAAVIPAGATGPQIENLRRVFREEFSAFKKYMNVCNAISALIIEAIDPVYLATLRLPYVGIGTRTPLEILAHLYASYANITPSDLEQNGIAMQQPCDVDQPIEVFYKQIEDGMEFADAGQTPYSPEQILSIAYQGIFRTGIFADDCKIWKRQAAAYKTWAQFKIDFRVAYQEYNEARDIAPRAAGFHAQNQDENQQDATIDAIANLATATAADRTAVATLTTTNAALTKSLAISSEKLVTALTRVNTLTAQLAAASPNNVPRAPYVAGVNKHYCWTCGYKSEHSSWMCTTPAVGHQKRAKAADTMGGSIVNKPV